jgi:hypothetical protein
MVVTLTTLHKIPPQRHLLILPNFKQAMSFLGISLCNLISGDHPSALFFRFSESAHMATGVMDSRVQVAISLY